MNLVMGQLLGWEKGTEALSHLRETVLATLAGKSIKTRRVIDACGELSERLSESEHIPALMRLGLDEQRAAIRIG